MTRFAMASAEFAVSWWKPIVFAWGCASSSSRWAELKWSWKLGHVWSSMGRAFQRRRSCVKQPARCRMIFPMSMSCWLVAGDFAALAMVE